MSLRLFLRRALLCAVTLVPAAPALAYFDSFIHGTVIGSMSQKEAAALYKTVSKTLDDGADGAVVPWTYPASGKRKPIEGNLTPMNGKTDKGQSCRQLKLQLKRADQEDNWTGWFCKQGDGRWRSRKLSDG
ncbi:RT0821/Lpp0805 family surface protein [Cupriavidus basilensis]|uniref:Surface antigen domain-containing protein n=1 Tax=Cupriavidus basilensis TaxID=68895 RepID=A0A643G045_9BURK|nr:RT0821/Lpp0805 family surface protein [Cupriavidus basilensis]MDR3383498.1 RT0821/Lpp0805 family surface protein [Cupriavidus basilensis]QOT78062.1 hypothetical protein F7R26_008620 [Cupriavidus basilensis]